MPRRVTIGFKIAHRFGVRFPGNKLFRVSPCDFDDGRGKTKSGFLVEYQIFGEGAQHPILFPPPPADQGGRK